VNEWVPAQCSQLGCVFDLYELQNHNHRILRELDDCMGIAWCISHKGWAALTWLFGMEQLCLALGAGIQTCV
jgi:hypothetical protein